jgi:hypothetical protein
MTDTVTELNDFAAKALHAVNVAQAEIRGRPVLSLAVAGCAVSCLTVYAGARGAAARATGSITTWFGLLTTQEVSRTDNGAGIVCVLGIGALILLWLAAISALRSARRTEAQVWTVAAAWATPFLLGPPLLDTHVYLDTARGMLQRLGRSPYTTGVGSLPDSPIVNAVDPSSRSSSSAAGPLGTVIDHLAVAASGGHVLGAVVILRALAVVSFVALGRSAADLAGTRRCEALTLVVLNPLTLLHVVNGAHPDGLMMALIVTALVAANQRRWLRAVTLVAIAGAVLPVALVVAPVIIAVHLGTRRGAAVGTALLRDVAVTLAVVFGLGFAVSHGLRWMHNADDQFSDYTSYAPANLIGRVLSPVVPGASFDDLAAGGRVTGIIAVVAIAGYLVVSARYRPVELSAGYALLATALLAPDIHPWFVLWAVACLGPVATGLWRTTVVVLSAVASLVLVPGFTDAATTRVAVVAICVGGVFLLAALWRHRDPDHETGALATT